MKTAEPCKSKNKSPLQTGIINISGAESDICVKVETCASGAMQILLMHGSRMRACVKTQFMHKYPLAQNISICDCECVFAPLTGPLEMHGGEEKRIGYTEADSAKMGRMECL